MPDMNWFLLGTLEAFPNLLESTYVACVFFIFWNKVLKVLK